MHYQEHTVQDIITIALLTQTLRRFVPFDADTQSWVFLGHTHPQLDGEKLYGLAMLFYWRHSIRLFYSDQFNMRPYFSSLHAQFQDCCGTMRILQHNQFRGLALSLYHMKQSNISCKASTTANKRKHWSIFILNKWHLNSCNFLSK